jgi:hypothetical protein
VHGYKLHSVQCQNCLRNRTPPAASNVI